MRTLETKSSENVTLSCQGKRRSIFIACIKSMRNPERAFLYAVYCWRQHNRQTVGPTHRRRKKPFYIWVPIHRFYRVCPLAHMSIPYPYFSILSDRSKAMGRTDDLPDAFPASINSAEGGEHGLSGGRGRGEMSTSSILQGGETQCPWQVNGGTWCRYGRSCQHEGGYIKAS